MRILLTCVGLGCFMAMLLMSHAEKQQEAALDRLSSYRLGPQPFFMTILISNRS
jgi:hypothetical protein